MPVKEMKETLYKRVMIKSIGELQVFSRKDKPDYSKKTLDVITADDQLFFCEVRNSLVPTLNHFKEGDIVDIEFFFAGSIKGTKKYNNIIVGNIRKV